ncbi:MAG: hypothetical protein WC867_03320 [Candidatus Pacearchaeota archaeon]|jgi:hypothetical protein
MNRQILTEFTLENLDLIANLYGAIRRLSSKDGAEGLIYEPIIDKENNLQSINYNIERLTEYLSFFAEDSKRLSEKLKLEMIKKKSLFFDFHPSKTYKEGQLSGRPLIYLGHITDKRTVNIYGKDHEFFECRSNEDSYPGFQYPKEMYNASGVYTNGEYTWFDNPNVFEHNSIEEETFYLDNGIELPLRSHMKVLDRFSLEELIVFKRLGEKNYKIS